MFRTAETIEATPSYIPSLSTFRYVCACVTRRRLLCTCSESSRPDRSVLRRRSGVSAAGGALLNGHFPRPPRVTTLRRGAQLRTPRRASRAQLHAPKRRGNGRARHVAFSQRCFKAISRLAEVTYGDGGTLQNSQHARAASDDSRA